MRKDLQSLCREVGWSQWVALGVSGKGTTARHAIDLEAAIAFLPAFETLDPRLYAEAMDWCIQFAADYVSVAALKTFLALMPAAHRTKFVSVANIVNAQGGTKWPTASEPGSDEAGHARDRAPLPQFRPSGKSQRRIGNPAAVQLRGRKIFGVSARADMLVALAMLGNAAGNPEWTHVNTFSGLGYQKRNLSHALTDLCDGGVVHAHKVGNTVRYEFVQAEPVRKLLQPLPETAGVPWAPLMALAAALLDVQARTHNKSQTTQGVEVNNVLSALRPLLARNQIAVPSVQAGDPWPQLLPWLARELQP
ncbi:MAG TPA: hypothetical protein PLF40_32925 [Kofleriaceae bacterium]|nr:hypothetical protein [Kofleriaceae bacterium]